MSGRRTRALVIGTDTRAFLAVVRSLGRAGVEVRTVSTISGSPACRSKYITHAYDLPRYELGDDGWLQGLVGILTDGMTDLLIPCPEWAVGVVDANRERLEQHCAVALPSPEALHAFLDKNVTREVANRVGVRVPTEWCLTDLSGLEQLRAAPLPLVVKPPSSLNPADPYNKRMVVKAYSYETLREVVAEELSNGPVHVQENVLGRGVGVELLVDGGEIVGSFQHERIHEPLLGGGSSYRRSVAIDAGLLEASARLVSAVNYTGVAMVEFKQRDDGVWWLMEVNPRFWGSLPLAVAAGADFPAGLCDLLIDGVRPQWHPRSNIYCRNLLADVRWWMANLKADRRDSTLATAPPLGDALASLGRLVLGREHLDTLVLDDPGPWLGELDDIQAGVSRALRAFILNLGPVRSMMRRRAQRALRDAHSVLFVCKGNICRSPFAAEVFRNLRPSVTVWSTGYFEKSGRSSPEVAVDAAQRLGIDLTNHRSSVLSENLLVAADAVFVFDIENWDTLRKDSHVSHRRLHFVGALDEEPRLQIEDPWGSDAVAFDVVYRRIARALAR